LLFGYLGLFPLMEKNHLTLPIWAFVFASLALSVVFVLVMVRIASKSGQGGWRLNAADQPHPPVGDRTPDQCWKGGLIYYNPDDPALWVEKRFGVGWTVNCGNPRSWLLLGGLLLFAMGVPLLSIVLIKK
jgi:uncharacterized membrane protein